MKNCKSTTVVALGIAVIAGACAVVPEDELGGASQALALDPQEVLFRNRFIPKTSAWASTDEPARVAYHALAAIYGWKRHQMGHSFGTTFGTNAIDLKTAAIVAADKLKADVQTAGWAGHPTGSSQWQQENGFSTGMAAWALSEVGGILLQYGSDTTKAKSYLDLVSSRLDSTSNGFRQKGGYQCGALNGVNYDHDISSHWSACQPGYCSYWSIYDPINGTTCTSNRRYLKNRNLVMGVASLAYDKYRPSPTTHRERGERAIRSQAIEIGSSGTGNNDYFGKADPSYGTKPWDDHNWAEAMWMLHAGELISRYNPTQGNDRKQRAEKHYVYVRSNVNNVERRARAGCHFARMNATAWTDCKSYYTSSISDPAAYGLVVDEAL